MNTASMPLQRQFGQICHCLKKRKPGGWYPKTSNISFRRLAEQAARSRLNCVGLAYPTANAAVGSINAIGEQAWPLRCDAEVSGCGLRLHSMSIRKASPGIHGCCVGCLPASQAGCLTISNITVDVGGAPSDLGIIIHLALYSGWPNALYACDETSEAMMEKEFRCSFQTCRSLSRDQTDQGLSLPLLGIEICKPDGCSSVFGETELLRLTRNVLTSQDPQRGLDFCPDPEQ